MNTKQTNENDDKGYTDDEEQDGLDQPLATIPIASTDNPDLGKHREWRVDNGKFSDITLYHPDHHTWTRKRNAVRGERPPVLFNYKKPEGYKPANELPTPRPLIWNNQIVLDLDSFPVRDFPQMPLKLSTAAEDWRMIALIRLDPRIRLGDLRARMCRDSRGSANAINMTMVRARRMLRIMDYDRRNEDRATPLFVAKLEAEMTQAMRDQNSTRELTDMLRNEVTIIQSEEKKAYDLIHNKPKKKYSRRSSRHVVKAENLRKLKPAPVRKESARSTARSVSGDDSDDSGISIQSSHFLGTPDGEYSDAQDAFGHMGEQYEEGRHAQVLGSTPDSSVCFWFFFVHLGKANLHQSYTRKDKSRKLDEGSLSIFKRPMMPDKRRYEKYCDSAAHGSSERSCLYRAMMDWQSYPQWRESCPSRCAPQYTPGDGLLCGVYALAISLAGLYKRSDLATMTETAQAFASLLNTLRLTRLQPRLLEFVQDDLRGDTKMAQEMELSSNQYLSISQLSALVDLFSEVMGRPGQFSLSYVDKVRCSEFGSLLYKGQSATPRYQIWVLHRQIGIGHWEGIAPAHVPFPDDFLSDVFQYELERYIDAPVLCHHRANVIQLHAEFVVSGEQSTVPQDCIAWYPTNVS